MFAAFVKSRSRIDLVAEKSDEEEDCSFWTPDGLVGWLVLWPCVANRVASLTGLIKPSCGNLKQDKTLSPF